MLLRPVRHIIFKLKYVNLTAVQLTHVGEERSLKNHDYVHRIRPQWTTVCLMR